MAIDSSLLYALDNVSVAGERDSSKDISLGTGVVGVVQISDGTTLWFVDDSATYRHSGICSGDTRKRY